jgi:Anti-sigma-K factor rskA/Putative zinc-finger
METGIHELTAGYALDALAPEERRAYEQHLEDCERCQEELGSFWVATDALALAASGPAPGDGLRGRILATARAERQNVVSLEPRRRRLVPAVSAVAAVAAAVAVAVGLWASQLRSDLDDTRLALERERAVAEVLSDPDSRTIALEAGTGRLVVSPEGSGVLVLDELDRAPEGKTYEAWIVEQGTPVAAGIFPGSEGRDRIPLEGSVDPGDVVAVTIEDRRVTAPEGEMIVASEPA